MQAGGDYLDDARASGALGIQARVWQPLRLPRAGGISKNLLGTRLLKRIYKLHQYNYQNFSPLAKGTDLNRQNYTANSFPVMKTGFSLWSFLTGKSL